MGRVGWSASRIRKVCRGGRSRWRAAGAPQLGAMAHRRLRRPAGRELRPTRSATTQPPSTRCSTRRRLRHGPARARSTCWGAPPRRLLLPTVLHIRHRHRGPRRTRLAPPLCHPLTQSTLRQALRSRLALFRRSRNCSSRQKVLLVLRLRHRDATSWTGTRAAQAAVAASSRERPSVLARPSAQ